MKNNYKKYNNITYVSEKVNPFLVLTQESTVLNCLGFTVLMSLIMAFFDLYGKYFYLALGIEHVYGLTPVKEIELTNSCTCRICSNGVCYITDDCMVAKTELEFLEKLGFCLKQILWKNNESFKLQHLQHYLTDKKLDDNAKQILFDKLRDKPEHIDFKNLKQEEIVSLLQYTLGVFPGSSLEILQRLLRAKRLTILQPVLWNVLLFITNFFIEYSYSTQNQKSRILPSSKRLFMFRNPMPTIHLYKQILDLLALAAPTESRESVNNYIRHVKNAIAISDVKRRTSVLQNIKLNVRQNKYIDEQILSSQSSSNKQSNIENFYSFQKPFITPTRYSLQSTTSQKKQLQQLQKQLQRQNEKVHNNVKK